MSGISFESVERNADRINYIVNDARDGGADIVATAMLTILAVLVMPEQDFALATYDSAERHRAMGNSMDFLKRAGIQNIL